MKTTEDLFKASEEIGQGDKSEIQGGREMRLTEAVEILNKVGAYVNVALRELQEKRIQQALDTGYRYIYGDVPLYKEAISLLIECGRTDLLKQGYHKKTYESVCKAYPLLKQIMYDSIHSGKRIGEAEAKGNVWVVDIKAYWDSVVLPLLQTDAEDVASPTLQTKAEAPHRRRPKTKSITWLVENPDGHLEVLHKETEGKSGMEFFCFIKAAFLKGWFMRPSYGALEKEFGNRGVKSCYSKCMSNNNEKELEPLGEMLESRYQKL